MTKSLRTAAILLVVATSTAAARGAADADGAGAPASKASHSAIHNVYPSDNLTAVVAAARSGDSIILHAGDYPKQYITKNFGSTLFIRGATGETANVAGFTISGSNLSISHVHLTGGSRVFRNGHDVKFSELAVSVSSSVTAFSLESGTHDVSIVRTRILGGLFGVKFFGRPDATEWPTRIRIANNEIAHASMDEVQIDGGRNSVIAHNNIHDPQVNGDHNDGIQVIASNQLRLLRNRIHFESYNETGGPNQGIILGHADPPDPTRRVTKTVIAGNIIDHWPGTPILLAGSDNTQIFNNTAYDSGWESRGPAVVITSKRQSYFQNRQTQLWNNIFNRLEIDRGATPPSYCGYNLVSQGVRGSACRFHLIARDPRFIDHVSYRLRGTSPARNTGTRDPRGLTQDIDGHRYGKPDRGARSR